MSRRFVLSRAGSALGALVFGSLIAVSAWAQAPDVRAQKADYAQQEAQKQTAQPFNNQPVWSEVRSGLPQTATIPGRETNVLIQPRGETWRALRVPLSMAGGLLFALALGGLAVFYLFCGPLTVEEKPGERMIERFSPLDRYAHWLLAISWVTLAVTGLILSLGKAVLLPLIGYTLFSWLAVLAKNLHNFIGPVLIVAVPFLFFRFVRYNGLGIDDVKWFLNIMGYFRGHEHPSGKFNAGEKLVFWLVLVFFSTVLVVTGLILNFPNFDQTRSTMQSANIVHMAAAYLAIALACVHIYLGTIGMRSAYRAMRYGYVTASWAKHHHLRWYEDVVAGRSPDHFVDPQQAPVPSSAVPANTKPA